LKSCLPDRVDPQAPLYLALVEQLAGEPNSPVELREAVYWARRAVHVHDWRNAESIGVLARLHQAAGRADEAEATLRRGLRAALAALGGSPTAPSFRCMVSRGGTVAT